MNNALYESNLSGLERVNQGKVRDIYAVDDQHLLIVTTDRLSAFDVILPDPIPGKGAVLTNLSNFWFERTAGIVPNHLTDVELADVITDEAERNAVGDRAIVVKRLQPLPVEAVVRGYLIGSCWKDYQKTGAVCGIDLPPGLELAAQLQNLFSHQRPKRTLATMMRTSISRACATWSVRNWPKEFASYRSKSTCMVLNTQASTALLLPTQNLNLALMTMARCT